VLPPGSTTRGYKRFAEIGLITIQDIIRMNRLRWRRSSAEKANREIGAPGSGGSPFRVVRMIAGIGIILVGILNFGLPLAASEEEEASRNNRLELRGHCGTIIEIPSLTMNTRLIRKNPIELAE
jgi:hypothetical protein